MNERFFDRHLALDIFNWGDKIPWSATVTDPGDPSIDCTKVTLTFTLGHDRTWARTDNHR